MMAADDPHESSDHEPQQPSPDEAPPRAVDPWGETEVRPSSGPPPDATRADLPPTEGEPSPGPSGGAGGTPPADRAPGGTGILPPVPAGPPAPEPRWSARAQVRPADVEEPADEDWVDPGRSPWVPILIAVGVLILIGLIVLGAVLLSNNRDTPGPAPITTSASTQASTPAPSTITRTSAAPTTSAPVPVPIPDVKGLTYDEAAAKLQAAGFLPNRRDEISGQQPAGRVVGTDPPANTVILTGTKIDIIVSKGLPTPTTPPVTTSPAAPSPTAT